MDYIAEHYHMDLALARPPRLSSRPACHARHERAGGGQAWSLGLEGAFYHVLSQGNARESKKSKKRPFYEFINCYLQNILTEQGMYLIIFIMLITKTNDIAI